MYQELSEEEKKQCYSKLNSRQRPRDFPSFDFDIHVYYSSPSEREKAVILRDKMRNRFSDCKSIIFVGELIDIPVGPHLTPMWEANFPKESLLEIVLWLMENRGELKILIHKLTGDDYWDHTSGALYMGGIPPVNADFFK